jgi:hydroxymethylpyrimidine/phosphomethylpyrimidine kinase
MLSSAETIDVIAETLQAHKVPAIVLDPVNKRRYPPLLDYGNVNY